MSGSIQGSAITFEDVGETWNLLSERIDAFISAWEAEGSPPPIASFLPDGHPTLAHFVLVELIKVDLEQQWLRGRGTPRIEDYLAEHTSLDASAIPIDLIHEELHVRERAGDAVTVEEYFDRFPSQADQLRRLFDIQMTSCSTKLGRDQEWKSLKSGDQIDDFDLILELGRGAFSVVFLARQRSMQRMVALKVSSDSGDEPLVLAQMDHRHIVRVYDQRSVEEVGARLLYLEYVPGCSLADVVAAVRSVPFPERTGALMLHVIDAALMRRGESPPAYSPLRAVLQQLGWGEVVCWLGARMASALACAHDHGILHRDIKPANVLLTAEGAPKLVDFNVGYSSKLEGAHAGAFFGGSLAYMSPEHLEAFSPTHPREPDSLDGRTDIYSLGMLLWELLTGERACQGQPLQAHWSSTVDALIEQRRLGLEDLKSIPEPCPEGLEVALRRCLAPEPGDRFSNGEELSRELELCLQPRACKLLTPTPGGIQRLARRFPLTLCLVAGLVPNALIAVFNYVYNHQEIIAHLPDAEQAFSRAQAIINLVGFPLGLWLMALFVRPVLRARRSLAAIAGEELMQARQRSLSLGRAAALVSVVGWVLAGLAYPLGLQTALGSLPPIVIFHFFASLTLCGLLAAVQAFFLVTFLAVRVILPVLMRPIPMEESLGVPLRSLRRSTWFYLAMVSTVPMFSLAALVLSGSSSSLALTVLSIGGLVAFGLMLWLARIIQEDLTALDEFLSLPLLSIPDPVSADLSNISHLFGPQSSSSR